MPVYNGNSKAKDLYYGGTKIKEAYYGSTKVYSSGPLYYCYKSNKNYYAYINVNDLGFQPVNQIKVYAKKVGDYYIGKASTSSELEWNIAAIVSSVTENQLIIGSIMGTTTTTYNRDKPSDLYT